jgi:hypothetical protein
VRAKGLDRTALDIAGVGPLDRLLDVGRLSLRLPNRLADPLDAARVQPIEALRRAANHGGRVANICEEAHGGALATGRVALGEDALEALAVNLVGALPCPQQPSSRASRLAALNARVATFRDNHPGTATRPSAPKRAFRDQLQRRQARSESQILTRKRPSTIASG